MELTHEGLEFHLESQEIGLQSALILTSITYLPLST